MVQLVSHWFKRNFGNPDVLALFFLLALVILVLVVLGDILMPVIASIVIAYLLHWGVQRLENLRFPHFLAVVCVYAIFLALVCVISFGLLPLLWRQLIAMVNNLPTTLGRGQALLMHLPQSYPNYISTIQVQQFISQFNMELGKVGQLILSISLSSIPGALAVIIYLVLVPLLVYFFLMDRQALLGWLDQYLPTHRRVITQVWNEVHTQIGNYVGGKLIEMIIVWFTCYSAFALMGLQYAMVLSALVGVSVIVPYVGAVVVTVPVVAIAFLQWGWSSHFAYLVAIYAIIITLDANVLVPLLFSEAVELHPVAIILATLIFGRLWGFWGVFFAIPLAILIKAILNALPRKQQQLPQPPTVPTVL